MSEKTAIYKVSGKRKYDYDFDRTDLRRTWLVLGAIQHLDKPTVTSIAKTLSFSKSTVQKILQNLTGNKFPDLEINAEGAVYRINKWGIIQPAIVERFYLDYI